MKSEWNTAVAEGNLGALARMIATGADVNALDGHGQTALMLAARDGKTEVVSLLLEHGANPDHTAKYRLSALMLAAIGGHAAVVELLLAAGADLNIRGTGAPGFHEKTALDLARSMGHEQVVEQLRA